MKFENCKLIKIAPLIFALVFSLKVFSQANEIKEVNLSTLLKLTLENNQSVKKAKLDVENSRYRYIEGRAVTLPQINGSAGVNYNPLLQQSALPGEIIGQPGKTVLVALGQSWNANAGLTFNQVLLDLSLFTGLKAAATSQELFAISSELTNENIIEQVSTAYYALMIQRQQVIALDTTIANTQKLLNILQSQLQNGLVKKIDYDRISVSFSNLNSRKQQLLNSISVIENQLKFLAGLPISSEVKFSNVDVTKIEALREVKQITDFSYRTEVKLLKKQQELVNYQYKMTKYEYSPTVSLSANYFYQGLNNDFIFDKTNANWFQVSTIGLGLRVPIFDGAYRYARIKQFETKLKSINQDISLAEQSVELGYNNAKTQIENNLLTLSSQKKNKELAEDVYKSTIENYNNGLASLADLINAENGLNDAQNNYLTSLLNYKLSEIQLLKALGELNKLTE